MRTVAFLLVVGVAVCAARDRCKDLKEKCTSTNREDYLACTMRHRRSLDCPYSCEDTNSCATSCDECDCDSCYGCSYDSCNNCCSSCCRAHTSCRTHHCCHKACRTTCRSSNCRDSCSRSCIQSVKHETTSHSHSDSAAATRNATVVNTNKNLHNVTTVIHLNNIVNNTNVIDAPIRVNTTNLNNFSLPAAWTLAARTNQAVRENCCLLLSPRQCQRTNTFPFGRCFHYRYRMCGHACYSPVVHTYQQQTCPQQGQCQQRPVYVPQPSPTCAYSPTWPYVSCGRPQAVNCEGCYGHHFGQERLSCSPFCYDEGYGAGPYYRQGPFYQPSYSPFPPCQVTGTCGMYGNFFGFQPNPFMGFAPGMNAGYAPGGFPYPPPAYGNVPYGYPPSGVPLPNDGNDEYYFPPTQQVENGSKPENASVAGPFIVDDPVLYNPYNIYPYPYQVDNITRYPHIEAEISPAQSHSYAEIKIEADKEEENSI